MIVSFLSQTGWIVELSVNQRSKQVIFEMITSENKVYKAFYPYEIIEDEQYFVAMTITGEDII